MIEEKRKRKRKRLYGRAKLWDISEDRLPDQQDPWYSYTHDISLNGIRIITGKSVHTDTLMKVEFSLDGTERTISLEGKVQWVKTDEYRFNKMFQLGIKFDEPSPKTSLMLLGYIYKKDLSRFN